MLVFFALASATIGQPDAAELVGPPEWRAQWIWGSVHQDQGVGLFRKAFQLPSAAERMTIQMSGDDGYTLYLDGQEVANGGFWWETTNTYEIGPLAAGGHVLAARVQNMGFPGGLLLQATAVGPGLWAEVATDETWRFAGEAPDEFVEPDFDDTAWEPASLIGPPPVSPWGPLPIRFAGPTMDLELVASEVTLTGRTVTARATVKARNAEPLDRMLTLELAREGGAALSSAMAPAVPTGEWTPGETVEIEGSLTVGDFQPGGVYEITFGPCGGRYEDGTMKIGTLDVPARDVDYPLVTVRPHNGAPCLFVDGEPVFWLMHMSVPNDPIDIAAAAEAGVHLETIILQSGWVGVGKYDYSQVDHALLRALSADPKALILPRVHMTAPAEWLDANPDDIVGYCDPESWNRPEMGGARHPSYASDKWRADASEALRRLVRHVREAGFADHILGYHITAGIYGEWHYWNSPYYPDTSPVFEQAYAEWLRDRYPDDPPEARIPTIEDRRHGDVGMFRDPTASRWLVDYGRFLHQCGADSLIEMAKAVKDASDGRCLTLAFNGYLPDLNWNMEGDHREFDQVLRSPYLDAFSSPHSYGRRAPGQDGMMRAFPQSARATGKLWVDEEDDRTSLAKDPQFTHVTTMEESLEVLWRGFAQALTQNVGLWYMDQQGGWYRDPAIQAAFARMREIGEESLERARARASRVAVVASFDTGYYLADRSSGLDHVTNALINPQLEQLWKCGAPFDFYLLSELFEESVPDYDAYVFLDTFHMTDADYARVRDLRDQGKAVLFCYAPAFVSDTAITPDRMNALLGLEPTMLPEMMLPTGEAQSPGFVAEGLENGVVRNGQVFYCPAPPLSAAQLRPVFAAAGVHTYLDSEDPLMVGGGYLAVHAATAGPKTLHWPTRATWVDVRTGETLAEGVDTITVDMEFGRTLLLSVR